MHIRANADDREYVEYHCCSKQKRPRRDSRADKESLLFKAQETEESRAHKEAMRACMRQQVRIAPRKLDHNQQQANSPSQAERALEVKQREISIHQLTM
jgi:broad specificity polyphosphatase/5'/3'-nucleotidase SurE